MFSDKEKKEMIAVITAKLVPEISKSVAEFLNNYKQKQGEKNKREKRQKRAIFVCQDYICYAGQKKGLFYGQGSDYMRIEGMIIGTDDVDYKEYIRYDANTELVEIHGNNIPLFVSLDGKDIYLCRHKTGKKFDVYRANLSNEDFMDILKYKKRNKNREFEAKLNFVIDAMNKRTRNKCNIN